ncbi:hypothetical protein ABIE58_003174 [Roseovarius sp. MBR-78]|jgi:hypothetical protein|uniref:hypothetical protein n=1 Tax=Roseovarius sp. MBR-78 TaxID=3156460 RepID=UPI003396EB8A
MKHVLTALAIILTLAAPAQAFSITMDSLTPTITYPEPAPQPVTQGTTGINK